MKTREEIEAEIKKLESEYHEALAEDQDLDEAMDDCRNEIERLKRDEDGLTGQYRQPMGGSYALQEVKYELDKLKLESKELSKLIKELYEKISALKKSL